MWACLNFNSHAPWGAWLLTPNSFLTLHHYFNSHAPWGAWLCHFPQNDIQQEFQLTRSVGSVTGISLLPAWVFGDFNSHAPWGAWLFTILHFFAIALISTHTLRGERDTSLYIDDYRHRNFNSHAPWGAWHQDSWRNGSDCRFQLTRSVGSVTGKRLYRRCSWEFQLTRSVGSVTRLVGRR